MITDYLFYRDLIYYKTQALLILISDAFLLANSTSYNYLICMTLYKQKTDRLIV
jgi:hypothetical protein